MIDSNAKLRSIQMPFCSKYAKPVGGIPQPLQESHVR
ncbi:Uncharacterised protein [Klebsiella pneumoniae]|nr:Uncharacterised protein [Klebsiella pneumoniae]